MSSNPYRPKIAESYEDQLDDDDDTSFVPAHQQDEEEQLKPAFLDISHQQEQQQVQGGRIGFETTSSAPPTATESIAKSNFLLFLNFLSVDYYRPYFDVSTKAVLQRVKNSMDPRTTDVFALSAYEPVSAPDAEAQQEEVPTPPAPVAEFDLFGSVWIAFTLIFFIGATSNFNAYLAQTTKANSGPDYTLITLASTMVLMYGSVFPTLLWLVVGWFGAQSQPALFKLLALYGYIQAPFVIASLLCVIPVSAVQWLAVFAAGALSGTVLGRNLNQLVQFPASEDVTENSDKMPRKKKAMLATALVAHTVFTILLKLYFFQGAEVKI